MERGTIRNNVAAPTMPANTLLIRMVFMMHLLLKPVQPHKVNASEAGTPGPRAGLPY